MPDRITEDIGRLYEAGFMLGVLRALRTVPGALERHAGSSRLAAAYPVNLVLDRFAAPLAEPSQQVAARTIGRVYLTLGHLGGYTFLREYLCALLGVPYPLDASDTAAMRRWRRRAATLRLRYLQLSLGAANQLAPDAERRAAEEPEIEAWLAQVGLSTDALGVADGQTGGFLHADLLLWLQYEGRAPGEPAARPEGPRQDLLVVDTSIAAAGASAAITDLSSPAGLLPELRADVRYLLGQGAFTRLSIDALTLGLAPPADVASQARGDITENGAAGLVTKRLARYFTAFASGDKEAAKLIQAGSYAHGFLTFLERNALLPPEAREHLLRVHLAGHTGRSVSHMSLRPEQFHTLAACATIYQDGKHHYADQAQPLEAARDQIFHVIARNTASLFRGGSALVEALRHTLPEEGAYTFEEVLEAPDDFANAALPPDAATLAACRLTPAEVARWQAPGEGPTIRAAHAALIDQAMRAGVRYIFLTGSPGIGKTTTISQHLQRDYDQEGYLFFYASPRTAVNEDIFEKFARDGAAPSSSATHVQTEPGGDGRGVLLPAVANAWHATAATLETHAALKTAAALRPHRHAGEAQWAGDTLPVIRPDVAPLHHAQATLPTAHAGPVMGQTGPGAVPAQADERDERDERAGRPGVLSAMPPVPTADVEDVADSTPAEGASGWHATALATSVAAVTAPATTAKAPEVEGTRDTDVQDGAESSFVPRVPTLYAAHALGLTTNTDVIRSAGNRPAVKYLGAPAAVPPDAQARGIRFLDSAQVLAQARRVGPAGARRLRHTAEDTLAEGRGQPVGVLRCLCDAIGATLDAELPEAAGGPVRAIIAAVAIQALKRYGDRGGGDDTLEHLTRIFGSAYDSRSGMLRPERMRQLARRVRHLVFMVDEITGDDAGVAFYQRLATFLDHWHLEHYGFTVTLIVSDASITGLDVVRAHFDREQTAPDSRKIYLSVAPDEPVATTAPAGAAEAGTGAGSREILSASRFSLQGDQDAYLVNSNAFPASRLRLRYRLRLPVEHIPALAGPDELRQLRQDKALERLTNVDLIADVCVHLAREAARRAAWDPSHGAYQAEQVLVYVQNKARLRQLIDRIVAAEHEAGRGFEPGEHYAELHADIPDAERARLLDERHRDGLLAIFMTSSASRGLTFRRARQILVEIPRFGLETQLMELLQVMFRGRGGALDLGERTLTFYLGERVTVLEREEGAADALGGGVSGSPSALQQRRTREAALDLLTMLCLVKLCVITRIAGFAALRGRRVRVVPIGGKSVPAADRAYHLDLVEFAQALRRERMGPKAHDPALTLLEQCMEQVLGRAEFLTEPRPGSYLDLYRHLRPEAFEAWLTGTEPLQDAYVAGKLLIVPLAGELETGHQLSLADTIRPLTQNPQVEAAIRSVIGRQERYARAIPRGAQALRHLLRALADTERSQRLSHRGERQSSYYVLPLPVLVTQPEVAASCRQLQAEGREEEAAYLKDLLVAAIRDSYPLDAPPLPFGVYYRDFPFLLITSEDLAALRHQVFEQGRLLMSREMNVLAMLLADV